MKHKVHFHAFALLALLLAACGTTEETAAPGSMGTYKIGKPYQIEDKWYYPSENYSYNETGIASWYGPGFHGKRTANGERYDSNELTAAHPTLPMPSLARVTNLENGKSVVVRINDRGPYKAGRVIDVSKRTAQLLGFEKSGIAKVRVQVLADESRAIAVAAKSYGARSQEVLEVVDNSDIAPVSAPRNAVEVQDLPPVVLAQESAQDFSPSEQTEVVPLPPQFKDSVLREPPYNAPSQPVVTRVKVTQKTDIYVQAGAFTMRENASKLRDKLDRIDNASIVPAVVNGKSFYRVRLGPIATVDQADGVLRKVMAAGVSEPRIIVD